MEPMSTPAVMLLHGAGAAGTAAADSSAALHRNAAAIVKGNATEALMQVGKMLLRTAALV